MLQVGIVASASTSALRTSVRMGLGVVKLSPRTAACALLRTQVQGSRNSQGLEFNIREYSNAFQEGFAKKGGTFAPEIRV